MAETTTFNIDGKTFVTGAAGSRCYRDLVRQRGEAAAQALVRNALLCMPEVRKKWPGGQGQQRFDITVEGFLLAAGFGPEVPRLAAEYRRSRGRLEP